MPHFGSYTELGTQIYLAVGIGIVEKQTDHDMLDVTNKISALRFSVLRSPFSVFGEVNFSNAL